MKPTPSIRAVLPLPTTPKAAEERRRGLHALAKAGRSREELVSMTLIYSDEVLDSITGTITRRRLVTEKACKCGCRRKALGRALFATDACRQRYDHRKRMSLKRARNG
jgi:hypothetical protein